MRTSLGWAKQKADSTRYAPVMPYSPLKESTKLAPMEHSNLTCVAKVTLPAKGATTWTRAGRFPPPPHTHAPGRHCSKQQTHNHRRVSPAGQRTVRVVQLLIPFSKRAQTCVALVVRTNWVALTYKSAEQAMYSWAAAWAAELATSEVPSTSWAAQVASEPPPTFPSAMPPPNSAASLVKKLELLTISCPPLARYSPPPEDRGDPIAILPANALPLTVAVHSWV
jgi:hypothetical protein